MPINMQVEYPKLQAEIQRLKRLLHDLTPGGSEFYDDLEYCAKWIRENREENHYSLVKQIAAIKEKNKQLVDALQDIKNMETSGSRWDVLKIVTEALKTISSNQ